MEDLFQFPGAYMEIEEGLPFVNFDLPAPLRAPVGSVEDEAPLLDELGVDPRRIFEKAWRAALPWRAPAPDLLEDRDLAGPLLFHLLFGALLALRGRSCFRYLYSFNVVSVLVLHFVFALMSPRDVDLSHTASIFGYGALPLVPLAALSLFVEDAHLEAALALAAGAACTAIATRMYTRVFGLGDRVPLVAVPVFLFYAMFLFLVVF